MRINKEIELEYQLHGLEWIFVFAFLNRRLLIVYVDVDHVDELFHRELMI